MAMAPALRVGGRIACTFLSRFNTGTHTRISNRGRSCRTHFTISAYKNSKSSAAAEWEEASEIYFAKFPSSSQSTSSEPTNPHSPPRIPSTKLNSSKRFHNSDEVDERTTVIYTRQQNSAEGSHETISSKDSKALIESQFDEENDDEYGVSEVAEYDDLRVRRKLPTGIRRLRRGYGRNDMRRYYDPREEDDKPSEVPPLRGEPLYGVGPVRAALQARRRDLYVLYVQDGMDERRPGKKKAPQDVVWILKMAKKLELRVEKASKHVLNMLVDSRPHQGLVLDASPLEMVDISALENPGKMYDKAPVWVALDEVKDPQNFGAILRSSFFFGVSGVVVCAKNSAPLSGVVSKASAGALEMIDLLSCKNMMMFLRDSSENGWRILGTSNTADSVVMSDLPKNVPTILVLGNEGVGIRPFVKAACTHMVRIPGALPLRKPKKQVVEQEDEEESGDSVEDPKAKFKAELKNELQKLNAEVDCFLRPGTVDSLNVSVAAGVLLNELMNFVPEKSKLLTR